MVKRFLSFGLALLLSFSFLFYLPNEKVSAFSSDDISFDKAFSSLFPSYSLHLNPGFETDFYNLIDRCYSDLNPPFSDLILFDYRQYSDNSISLWFVRSSDVSYFDIKNNFIYFYNSDSEASSSVYGVSFSYISSSSSFKLDHGFEFVDNRALYVNSNCSTSLGHNFFLDHVSSTFISSDLTFSLSPELTLDMDLDSVQNSLTVSVDNPTEKAYDYMLYVSSTPAATSLTTSLYNMSFASSSKQWCYTKQSDSSVPPDLQQLIKDNASDTFTTSTIIDTLYPGSTGVLFNVWGSQFKAYSEYLSYKEDHITFYSLSQTNCPIYLINREDSRSHVIPFSSFNIEMGKTYYFNIIYREHDQTVVGALGTSTTALLAAGNGQYSYPVFDTSQFTSYQNYSSTEFSVTNGMVSNPQKDDLTDFHSVAYYSNPDNSTAYITNDNSVNINNSFNSGSGSGDGGYDPSCSTNYINHGVIYHGCTIYNSPSGSGSGSSGLSVPDLPEFEFTELYEKSGGFFDFVKLVIENSGWIPVTIFSSLCLVVLFCRIWGR